MVVWPLCLMLLVSYQMPVQAFLKPQYDVIIDVGHGGVDGGTSFNGILEKEINLLFGLELYRQLADANYQVAITRIDDYALSDDYKGPRLNRHSKDLRQRAFIANVLKPTIYLSVHINWSKSKKAHGPIVIYQKNDKSYSLATIIQKHLNNLYQTDLSVLKGKKYYLMNYTDTAAIITELGFISHSGDRAKMLDEQIRSEIVQVMVEGINEYMTLIGIQEEW